MFDRVLNITLLLFNNRQTFTSQIIKIDLSPVLTGIGRDWQTLPLRLGKWTEIIHVIRISTAKKKLPLSVLCTTTTTEVRLHPERFFRFSCVAEQRTKS